MNVSMVMDCQSGQLLCFKEETSFCLDYNEFQCSFLDWCDCPPPKAEPGIAGTGVLVAFSVSAFLTWISTFAYLLLVRHDKRRRFNIIDEFWTRHINNWARKRVKNPDVLAQCFFRLTLALSDQQLVTGIAILIAGLRSLSRGTISVYHFSIVRDMAFFSSSAHMLSLLALWNWFTSDREESNTPHSKRRIPLSFTHQWRIFCMFIFIVLLLVTTWTTAFKSWDDMYSCPAICVPRGIKELGGKPLAWAIASTYLLVFSYCQWTMQLGEQLFDQDRNIRRWARLKGAALHETAERGLKNYPVLLTVFRKLREAALLWRLWAFSDTTDLISMLAWLGADLSWTVKDKIEGYDILELDEWRKEQDMGFGQIVPLVLLMLPMMAFVETYHDNMLGKGAEEEDGELDSFHS